MMDKLLDLTMESGVRDMIMSDKNDMDEIDMKNGDGTYQFQLKFAEKKVRAHLLKRRFTQEDINQNFQKVNEFLTHFSKVNAAFLRGVNYQLNSGGASLEFYIEGENGFLQVQRAMDSYTSINRNVTAGNGSFRKNEKTNDFFSYRFINYTQEAMWG